MTGIAIVLYLNQTPEPAARTRLRAYAGSFYAFAIWIGMGVAGIIRLLQHYAKMKELPAAAIVQWPAFCSHTDGKPDVGRP